MCFEAMSTGRAFVCMQVEASLPLRLRNTGDTREPAEDYGGLEAISGTFGEGIDEGLRVSTRRRH